MDGQPLFESTTLWGRFVDFLRALPRSTMVIAGLTIAVFVSVGLISCQGLDPLEKPLPPFDAALPAQPDIRVRIRSTATEGTVDGPHIIEARTANRGRTWRLRTPVKVILGTHGFELTGLDGVAARPPAGESVILAAPGETLLRLDGSAYPGTLRLRPRSDAGAARFDVIATMPIEAYLPGVLAKELYHSWPLAAFQAQAVAARSYALHERQRSRDSGRSFDVEATTQDQAFGGAVHLPVANRAVESTHGLALTWGGQILRAYYSSTNGGRAASAADTWPTGPGYEFNLAVPLQASDRQYAGQGSMYHRWQTRRGRERLSLRFRRWAQENGHPAKNIGQITIARPIAVNTVGRPTHYRITDHRKREFSMTAEQLRVACNWPVPGVPRVGRPDRVRSGDLTMKIIGDRVHIDGRGFGHGVGLCQWSTAAFAKRGDDHRTILLRFYPGAKLERVY